MDLNSINTIIGGIVTILVGILALRQTAKPPVNVHSGASNVVPKAKKPDVSRPVAITPVVKQYKPKVAGVVEFSGDDAGYREWIESHPQGFVLNTNRSPNPKYMPLHKATCNFVSNFSSNATGAFTERDFIKVCSSNVNDLREWIKTKGRPDGTFTGNCHCKPEVE